MGEFLQLDRSLGIDEPRISRLSQRELKFIIIGGIVSASLGLLLARPVDRVYDFTPLILSANTVSMIFAIGLFYFLTAGLLFSSRASHLYLLSKIDEVGARKALLIRTLHVLAITSLFTIIFTILVFLYPVILALWFHSPVSFDHFVFFLAVLGASLVGSILLSLIAVSLTILTDDHRLCVVLGCASTLLIASLSGWNAPPSRLHFSLSRNLAFLSPHNIIRALAVQLSGYQFESARRMVQYVGFAFSTDSLVVVLFLFSSISVVSLLVMQRILIRNSKRWKPLGSVPQVQEIWPTAVTPEKIQKTARLRRGLRVQRSLVIIAIGALLVSMMTGVSSYKTYLSSNTVINHYATPGLKERIPVGTWNVFDVDVLPPYPGLFNSLFLFFTIISWGNASDSLSFYRVIVNMNSIEFLSLDEQDRLALCPRPLLNVTPEGNEGFGLGYGLEESYGSYVCALLIIADTNPLEHSYIELELLIVQEGR